MDRYQQGKIYQIYDNTNGNKYIGSTCKKTLASRLAQHVYQYKRYVAGKSMTKITSFDILKNSDYAISLLEECSCETKDQLLARERFHIENNICVNKICPIRTEQEHREQTRLRQRKYVQNNKEKLKLYREQNKEYNKQYREQNKEKLKE